MLYYIHRKCIFWLFRLVGDNIDFEVHARIQSEVNRNRSIHWTQQYAIRNKISENLPTCSPQQSLKDFSLGSVLPGPDVMENLTQRWAVLVSRVICKYLPKFQHLQKAAVIHIPHKYSSVVNQKSDIVRNNLLNFIVLTFIVSNFYNFKMYKKLEPFKFKLDLSYMFSNII
jgi:hypothetical protein